MRKEVGLGSIAPVVKFLAYTVTMSFAVTEAAKMIPLVFVLGAAITVAPGLAPCTVTLLLASELAGTEGKSISPDVAMALFQPDSAEKTC